MNIPNTLTLFRIGLIPVFMYVFYMPQEWAPALATIIFFFASISDWLDGYLARKLNQQSKLGAFLDPLADKLMVTSALILLVAAHPESLLLTFSALIIIVRELLISALREFMAELGKRSKVAVSFFGKAKTGSQMFALLLLIYEKDLFGLPTFYLGIGFLVWAAFLTLLSMGIYIYAALGTLKRVS